VKTSEGFYGCLYFSVKGIKVKKCLDCFFLSLSSHGTKTGIR